jgi:hypothetical protein
MLPVAPVPGVVPLVDPFLQLVTNGQQRSIGRRQVNDNRFEPAPENVRLEADRRQEFLFDKVAKRSSNAQGASGLSIVHAQGLNHR